MQEAGQTYSEVGLPKIARTTFCVLRLNLEMFINVKNILYLMFLHRRLVEHFFHPL